MKISVRLFLFLLVVMLAGCTREPASGPEYRTFVDSRDQHSYRFIHIGDQVWMTENMAYLPSVGNGCYVYGFDGGDVDAARLMANYSLYGALYNWKTALSACPAGWHLPTAAEWYILSVSQGGDLNAGGRLKESGIGHWMRPNAEASDSSGFMALPGGCRDTSGAFKNLGESARFWSASTYTENDQAIPWYRALSNIDRQFKAGKASAGTAFSVRCIRN